MQSPRVQIEEVTEPHDPVIKEGTVQVAAWPVRIWFDVFEITTELQPVDDDPLECEWVETNRKLKRFFGELVTEEDSKSEKFNHLHFRKVSDEWLAREKEILGDISPSTQKILDGLKGK